MTSPKLLSLSIAAQSGKPLSGAQKKFNSLIGRIEKQCKLLAAWQAALPLCQERWSGEFKPLLDEYRARNREFVFFLDQSGERLKLTKTDRRTLGELICELASSLIGDDGDEALKALYNKHSGSDFDRDARAENELLKNAMEQAFGVDLGDDLDLDSHENVAQRLFEKLQAQAQAEQPAPRKGLGGTARKSAQQVRREEAEAQAGQSVREVYRKLASALHPDRETDAAERERKTGLMQRVNQAYDKGNLLDLLQLQLEVEQIDRDHIANLAEDRLRHYNRVLDEQLRELQDEVRALEQAFKAQFDLDPLDKVSPTNLGRKLQDQLRLLREDVAFIKAERELLEDPRELKRWLKEERKQQRADAFGEIPFDMLFR
ncbi:J domain-containing protein [Azotobacter chroococcum]|uniref:J domain-containing protein n=1 Tax=Azotobacter chroococcum TaxID=353 RepID=A0AAQ0C2D2_9GAMM|nr:J domain-containing protein [Azotobacter chroococcum]QQE91196.1 J domain-containing protein [Azotobacter chroococcum]TKD46827.1 molecular chaperone DnaJ [Azotobacter chroococcum]